MDRPSSSFQGRRAAAIESDALRVTVLEEGGHIAEIFHKPSGVSPLWVPQWKSIEPSTFDPSHHPEYGTGTEAKLLAGIIGHNLCLDIFGGPSEEEAAAGLTVHGEASIARYDLDATVDSLILEASLPIAGLRVRRTIELEGGDVRVRERVENLEGCDRPIGWTQHVTLAPPFLQHGTTEFRSSATRSQVLEGACGGADYLAPAAMFEWPFAPRLDGTTQDLRTYTGAASSSGYTAHLMNPDHEDAFFVAFTPEFQLAFGYVWRRADFPWMGIWEENRSRRHAPWNGREVTCGMEFGVSPFPESRRQMIDRGRLFDVPTYRWIPARSVVEVEYWIFARTATRIPESFVAGSSE